MERSKHAKPHKKHKQTKLSHQEKKLNMMLNHSRYSTNPPFQFPIWQLTIKETKRQAITKDKKNEMKSKPMEL